MCHCSHKWYTWPLWIKSPSLEYPIQRYPSPWLSCLHSMALNRQGYGCWFRVYVLFMVIPFDITKKSHELLCRLLYHTYTLRLKMLVYFSSPSSCGLVSATFVYVAYQGWHEGCIKNSCRGKATEMGRGKRRRSVEQCGGERWEKKFVMAADAGTIPQIWGRDV